MPAALTSYLREQDRLRAAATSRALHAFEPREGSLVREAAVMGYVLGTLSERAAPGAPVPRDTEIVELVVGECVHNGDKFPATAALSGHVRALSARDELNRDLLDIHTPVCAESGDLWKSCVGDHVHTPLCGTCTTVNAAGTGAEPSEWPCATVGALGRVALCEVDVEQPDLTAVRCPGFLVFTRTDEQARCVVCGAWCGQMVARFGR